MVFKDTPATFLTFSRIQKQAPKKALILCVMSDRCTHYFNHSCISLKTCKSWYRCSGHSWLNLPTKYLNCTILIYNFRKYTEYSRTLQHNKVFLKWFLLSFWRTHIQFTHVDLYCIVSTQSVVISGSVWAVKKTVNLTLSQSHTYTNTLVSKWLVWFSQPRSTSKPDNGMNDRCIPWFIKHSSWCDAAQRCHSGASTFL